MISSTNINHTGDFICSGDMVFYKNDSKLVGISPYVESGIIDTPIVFIKNGENFAVLTTYNDCTGVASFIYDSLARVTNAGGTLAKLWDSSNDGIGSSLDADLVRGRSPVKIVEPPDNLASDGEIGDISYKFYSGHQYMTFYTETGWIWWEANISNLPWQ